MLLPSYLYKGSFEELERGIISHKGRDDTRQTGKTYFKYVRDNALEGRG